MSDENSFILFTVVTCAIGALICIPIVMKRRRRAITSFDNKQVVLQNGKVYYWAGLERINFINVLVKGTQNERNHTIEFYFKEGKATTNYLNENIYAELYKIAEASSVKTTNVRTIGRFIDTK